MGILYRRPLAAVCFSVLFGMLIAALTAPLAKLILAGTMILALGIFLLVTRRKAISSRLITVCVIACLLPFAIGHVAFDRYFTSAESYGDEAVNIRATVTDLRYQTNYSTTLYAEAEQINGKRASGKLSVTLQENIPITVGDILTFDACLFPVYTDEDAAYLQAAGVYAVATDVENAEISGVSRSLGLRARALFTVWRDTLSGYLTDCIPGESGSLMSAMLLGRRELLSAETTQSFRRLGLTHVLSISGLHLSLLCGAVYMIAARLGLRRRGAATVQILFVLFYLALTAFPISAVRAGLMALVMAAAHLAAREADGITSLSLAAALICLCSPYAVYDCGFWLSVVATFGILVYNELRTRRANPRHPLVRFEKWLLSGTLISLCATFATLPLTTLFFGEVSLISPLANTIFTPILELYLLLSALALPLGKIPPVASLFARFGDGILWVARPFSRLRGIMISADHTTVKILLFVTVAAVFLCLCLPRIRRRALFATGGAGLALTAVCLIVFQLLCMGQNAIVYQRSGKNEQILLYQNGKAMLCDFSYGTYATAAKGVASAKELHLVELEGYYVSHYHTRQVNTLDRLAARTVIRHLYLPTPQSESEETIYYALCAVAEQYDIPHTRYTPYGRFAFGDMTVIPHATTNGGKGHGAAAISVEYGGKTFTYFGSGYHEGDLLSPAAEAVAESEILLFGAHGANESTAIPYRQFSSSLALILTTGDESRLPPALRAQLSARSIPYRVTNEWEYISFT